MSIYFFFLPFFLFSGGGEEDGFQSFRGRTQSRKRHKLIEIRCDKLLTEIWGKGCDKPFDTQTQKIFNPHKNEVGIIKYIEVLFRNYSVTTYQLAAFGEPFTKQRMCINLNQLALWVSDLTKKKGKLEYKMNLEYIYIYIYMPGAFHVSQQKEITFTSN